MSGVMPIELLVVLPVDTAIDRARAFEIACGGKPGFRMRRVDDGLEIVIDGRRIEGSGPIVEAAAIVTGGVVILRHPDGDLGIPVGKDLDARPSGVWAAIGDAVAADVAAAQRGEPRSGPFKHVVPKRHEGRLIATDARPPRVEPLDNAQPWEEPVGGQKYDDLDWHLVDTGSTHDSDRAFAHIGWYLGWLIRRDLHKPSAFSAGSIDGIKRGGPTSALVHHVDQKLTTHVMGHEGRAFSDARYGVYLTAIDKAYPDITQRRDDKHTRSQVDRTLDRIYADWIEAGRPDDAGNEETALGAETEQEQLDAVFRSMHIDWSGIRKADARKRKPR